MLGRAHPGDQIHTALQLLARQGPRRWHHLPCLRPPGCHGGEHRGEGIKGTWVWGWRGMAKGVLGEGREHRGDGSERRSRPIPGALARAADLCTSQTHLAGSQETQVSSCLQLCDLGQVIWPLWALVFSHVCVLLA